MPFWKGATTAAATTAAEEFPANDHSPIPSRPGIQYPIQAYPSLRQWYLMALG